MTERSFRYLITALLILPFIAFVDGVARPVSRGNHDLREILYLLISIPIVLLAYAAWFQPQITREMFGPFRPEGLGLDGPQANIFSRIDRRNLPFIGLGLAVILICACQFALGLTVANKFRQVFASGTPTTEVEVTQTIVLATDQTSDLTPTDSLISTDTPMPTGESPTVETVLTQTPTSLKFTPTIASALTKTPQTQTASKTYRVGEQFILNGVGVVVTDVLSTGSIASSTAASGYRYLVIEVAIQNLAHDGEIPYSAADFSIRDADGTQYQSSSVAMDPPLDSGSLAKGDSAQGFITFDVPTSASGFIATFTPGELLESNEPVQIDLGQ